MEKNEENFLQGKSTEVQRDQGPAHHLPAVKGRAGTSFPNFWDLLPMPCVVSFGIKSAFSASAFSAWTLDVFLAGFQSCWRGDTH